MFNGTVPGECKEIFFTEKKEDKKEINDKNEEIKKKSSDKINKTDANQSLEKEDKLEMKLSSEDFHLTKIIANKDELNEHDAKLKDIQERNSIEPIWRKF